MESNSEIRSKLGGIQDRRLGEILMGFSQVTDVHIRKALTAQKVIRETKNHHLRLGEIMVFQKVITTTQLFAALREQIAKAQQSRLETIAKVVPPRKSADADTEATSSQSAQPSSTASEPSPRAPREPEAPRSKTSFQNRMYRMHGFMPARKP